MANSFFGEAYVQVDDATWTARLDFNALIEYEDRTGRKALQDIAELERMPDDQIDVRRLRDLIWVLLMHHHPEVTLKEAGVVLSKAPYLFERVMAAAMPEPDPEADRGNGKAAGRKPAA